MEINDYFKQLIVTNLSIKSQINDYDKDKLWPYNLPKVAMREEEIVNFESVIGAKLPLEYRAFLSVTQGWDGFFQINDLIGKKYLEEEKYKQLYQETFLDLDEVSVDGICKEYLIPISMNLYDRDIFLLSLEEKSQGTVIWLAGEEIDRWNGFISFFESMIEYNKLELKRIKK